VTTRAVVPMSMSQKTADSVDRFTRIEGKKTHDSGSTLYACFFKLTGRDIRLKLLSIFKLLRDKPLAKLAYARSLENFP